MAGQDCSLTCRVISGDLDIADAVIAYRWTKTDHNGHDDSYSIETHSSVLSFSPLKLSNRGVYSCEISVNSSALIKNTMTTATYNLDVSSKHFDFCLPLLHFSHKHL